MGKYVTLLICYNHVLQYRKFLLANTAGYNFIVLPARCGILK